jgi:alkylation response protein AidB-like acyl-CoA dehydrogenase
MTAAEIHSAVADVAAGFAAERSERQQRTSLDRADFDRLAAAGLQRTGLPVERGGLWSTVQESTRTVCELYRTLAGGDPAVALVAAMHPSVLAFWLATPAVDDDPPGVAAAWTEQREWVFDTVERDGAWWGTITSEPGSGGDVTKSKTKAVRDDDAASSPGWRISGAKHFGSGTGISSFMLTTAVAEGDEGADWFFVPMAGRPLDGTAGVTLAAPWDGHGMAATQSHALTFDACPAERFAWPGHLDEVIAAAAPFFSTLFTGVVLGIVDTAIALAREQLLAKGGAAALRPFEQVEWARADLDAWTAVQAYEGALRAIESMPVSESRLVALRAKTVVAELAESCLLRLCRVLGGGTFSRRSPFGNWFEDVRALGFLRPPWGLAYDGLIAGTTSSTNS